MMRAFRFLALLVALLLAGCPASERQPEEPRRDSTGVLDRTFTPPRYDVGRTLDTIIETDLDGSVGIEYVVTSLAQDTFVPPGSRADLIEIYRFDSAARRYVIAVSDSLHWASDLTLRDVTGDGLPDLVAMLNSGGNDPISSKGMSIYSGDGGRIRTVFRSTRGDPEFETLPATRGSAVFIYDELWPLFATHAEAVPYVDDIHAYRGGIYVSVRHDHEEYFRERAQEHLNAYRAIRDSVATLDSLEDSQATRLFNTAAMVVLNFERANGTRPLRAFWDSERVLFETKLPQAHLEELTSLYARAMKL